MSDVSLKKFILPVLLRNTDENQNVGNEKFNTTDIVFLESKEEVSGYSENSSQRQTSPTDYALANGAYHWWEGVTQKGKKGVSWHFLRSASSEDKSDIVNVAGDLNS